jgi:hypothetical protein
LQAGARLALGKGAGPVDVLRAVQKRSQRC